MPAPDITALLAAFRACTVVVWVRSTLPLPSQKVSCMSRAGWCSGIFKASKLK